MAASETKPAETRISYMCVHAVDNNHAGERGSAAILFHNMHTYNYCPGVAKKETLFRRTDSVGGLVMSLAVLRDVTNNHFTNGILTTHGKIQCQSTTM